MKCTIRKVSMDDEKLILKILNNEIRLIDIPQKFRVKHRGIYISAFRVNRAISRKRYDEDLEILQHDISSLILNADALKQLYDNMKSNREFLLPLCLNEKLG